MLKDLSTLANYIKNKELKNIEKFLDDITHPGTRGDMYEGLTNKIICNTIGNVPQIHVCEGFVKNYRTNQMSKQMDLIIHINDSQSLPLCDHKVVSIDDTLAIIEVKKSFHKKEFLDFYDKQVSVYELLDDKVKYDSELFNQTKTKVFGKINWNGNESDAKSFTEYALYHLLMKENAAPLRICFGYDGISEETSLRDNFIKVIEERKNDPNKKRTDANSLPTLVISEDNCLVKMIGFPFICQFRDPFLIMSSYKGDTLRVLLTMLISKIESKTNNRFEFENDDFSQFNFNDFLAFSINKECNSTIYGVYPLTLKESKNNQNKMKKWEPLEITDYEGLVATYLCSLSYEKDPMLSIEDDLFKDHDLEAELSNLIKNCFISIHNGNVELLSTQASVVTCYGKYYIGENTANQMNNWVFEQSLIMKEMKKKQS